MASGDGKLVYAASASVTITVGTLAASTTVGRESLAVDNGTNLYKDIYVTVGFNLNGTIAGGLGIVVYAAGMEDGTHYDRPATGADAAITLVFPTNLKWLGRIELPAGANGGATMYYNTFPLAWKFGGIVPRKWNIALINDSGIAATAGSTITYTGVYDNIA
jgi:hypothetical protein